MSPSQFEIPCVILGGGKSSRMGEDKALLPFSHSNSLTQYQYDRLKPYFKNVYISSKTNKFDLSLKEHLILDKGEVYSPIVALKTIFEYLKNEERIFIITVDTPLIKIDTINELILNVTKYDICIPKTERIHNLCGVFSSSVINIIDEMIKNDIHKVGYLINRANSKILDFENEDEFINLNDKNNYQNALNIINSTYNNHR